MDELLKGERKEPSDIQREPLFNLPPVILALMGLCAAIHVLRLYVLTPDQDFDFFVRAAFVPARYQSAQFLDIYALTTPVTYSFLHGSFVHLAVNMVWLAAFGSPLANRIGPSRFLLFWGFTAIAAAALHFALHSSDLTPLVGASGAIAGMMGAAARFAFQIDRRSSRPLFLGSPLPVSTVLRSRSVLSFLAIWMVVNLVTGLISVGPGMNQPIAWEAHIGGFLAGFLCIGWFDKRHLPLDRDVA
jgi:membrane associated rhomboid family serine protease